MIILKKIMLMILLIFSLFTIISTVAAANYYVDSNTKHTDITNWMKKDAKKGDNLIFTGPKYDLTNTIVINKPINIKSENKTQINFKNEGDMFEVVVSGVNFDGLSLNHNGKTDENSAIYAFGGSKKINVRNTDIKVDNLYSSAIMVDNWQGNISNCKIDTGTNAWAVYSTNWVGNLVNSKISGYGYSIDVYKWKGNIVNSEISSTDFGGSINAIYWSGKITKSKISCLGYDYGYDLGYSGVSLYNSKGTITNSTIKVKYGITLGVSDEVKVSNCSIISEKKHPKIFRYRPDLIIDSVKKSGNNYKIQFHNKGPVDSKPCTLVIKYGNKILKKVPIKKTQTLEHGQNNYGRDVKVSIIKVVIPAKYANTKYTKTAIIDYYNVNKEYNKKNNQYKFKF